MEIQVISSFGTGKTDLSAFDNALYNAGVHNYNLIILSSIIPTGAIMKKVSRYTPETTNEWGHKLYAVKWDIRSNEIGKFISSGLGWYQREDGSGVLVEHDASGYDRKEVESDILATIEKSITDLCHFRKIKFDKSKMKYSYKIGKVEKKSGCAMAIAVFEAEGWKLL